MEKYSRILSHSAFDATQARPVARTKRQTVKAETEAVKLAVDPEPLPVKVELDQTQPNIEPEITYPRLVQGDELAQYIREELKRGDAYARAEYDAGRHPRQTIKRTHTVSCLVAEPEAYDLLEESKGIYLLIKKFI